MLQENWLFIEIYRTGLLLQESYQGRHHSHPSTAQARQHLTHQMAFIKILTINRCNWNCRRRHSIAACWYHASLILLLAGCTDARVQVPLHKVQVRLGASVQQAMRRTTHHWGSSLPGSGLVVNEEVTLSFGMIWYHPILRRTPCVPPPSLNILH